MTFVNKSWQWGAKRVGEREGGHSEGVKGKKYEDERGSKERVREARGEGGS